MLISCPNCATRYNIDAAYLGNQGRAVRCTNCGNTWHQNPVHAPPPPPMVPASQRNRLRPAPQAQPEQQYAYAGYPPQGYPQQGNQQQPYPPQGYPPPGYPPYPPPGYPPYPQQGFPGAPAAQQPAPTPAAAPTQPPMPVMDDMDEEEEEDDEPSLPDMDDVMEALGSDDEDEEDTDADEEEDLSQADLDAMFADTEDPAPLQSMVDDKDAEAADESPDTLDDLDDPDPIPQVFTADDDDDDEFEDDEEEGGGSTLKKIIILVVVLVVLGGIGGGGYFFWPQIKGVVAPVLEMVGIGKESLGEGLDIRDTKASRESIGGRDVLVVRGVIANVSEKQRQVPMVTLMLQDLDGKTVQSTEAAPLKSELNAGEQIGFRIELRDPSALARGLKVTFTERAKPGESKDKEKKKAH